MHKGNNVLKIDIYLCNDILMRKINIIIYKYRWPHLQSYIPCKIVLIIMIINIQNTKIIPTWRHAIFWQVWRMKFHPISVSIVYQAKTCEMAWEFLRHVRLGQPSNFTMMIYFSSWSTAHHFISGDRSCTRCLRRYIYILAPFSLLIMMKTDVFECCTIFENMF